MSEFTTFANQKLLKPTKWFADTLFVAPGGHRFRNALGLSAGLWIGDKFCNLITGQKLNGDPIDKQDYPAVLHPLYGIMSYNKFSDDPEDRWKFVYRGIITASFGAVGAVLGSYEYFLSKNPSVTKMLETPWHHTKHELTDDDLKTYRSLFEKGEHLLEEHKGLKQKIDKWLNACNPHALDVHVYNEMSKAYLVPAGAAAIPGSALGSNVTLFPLYPYLLGERFRTGMLGYKNAMPGIGKWFNNATIADKLSPHFLLDELAARVSDPKNLSATDAATRSNMIERVEQIFKGAIEPMYEHLKPEHVDGMKKEILSIYEKAVSEIRNKTPEEAKKEIEAQAKIVNEQIKGLVTGVGLNQFLKRHGVDLSKIHFENHGVSGTIAKWLGADLRQFTHEYHSALYTQGLSDIKPDELFPLLPKKSKILNIGKQLGFTAGTAAVMGSATAGVIYAFGGHKHPSDHEFENVSLKPTASATPNAKSDHIQHAGTTAHSGRSVASDFVGKIKDMVNGPFLNLSEAVVETFNVPPSAHRLMCAAGLSAMMIAGNTLMTALTRRNIQGVEVKKESMHQMWHTLFDKHLIKYGGRNSSSFRDQWMHVARMFVPSAFGFFGVLAGSKLFFNEKEQSLKDAKYLDEVDQKAAFSQSGPWAWLAAIGSFPSASMGVNLFPVPFNYGTALGGRFGLASDRAVMFPGVAEWWSNNHSSYPLQPAGLLKRMAAYGAYNPAQDLKQLDEMVPGILKHWYNNITPAQVQAFEDSFIALRNDARKRGLSGKKLENELLSHVTGQGLEEMLVGIGLNPADAIIGNNGMSGRIGNWLGAGGKVERLRETYKKEFAERRKSEHFKPRDFRHELQIPVPEADPNLVTKNAPVDISTSPVWAKNQEEKKGFSTREDIKPRGNLAAMPAKSHSEKALESKDNPAIGLTA